MARGYKSGIATGLALSAGTAALFGPLWQPLMARWGRPAIKNAVKGGLAAYEVARMRIAELGEKTQDLVAEAQIERSTERFRAAAASEPAPGAETATAAERDSKARHVKTAAPDTAGETESAAPERHALDSSLAT
jgi:hypothetical protein